MQQQYSDRSQKMRPMTEPMAIPAMAPGESAMIVIAWAAVVVVVGEGVMRRSEVKKR